MTSPNEETADQDLTLAIKHGDESAFAQLYYRYAGQLYNYLWRRTHQNDIAEDLVQETFARLWKNRANLDAAQSIKAYLYRTAHNLSIDHLRKKVLQTTVSMPGPGQEPSVLPDERFQQRDQINRAINQLPKTQKAVFCLSRFEGLKYTEIAKTLGISVKTVENHMNRALKKLRLQLRDFLVMCFWGFFSGHE